MAKNRALTLKKAHLRREKIQSALLARPDFLYIKDIADLCAMQTVDISNDLKEMTRLGLLSKKEDKTAHPKRLMYKLKPLAAARLVKESKVSGKKEVAKPAATRQDTATSSEKTVASAVPTSKAALSKTAQSKNGKSAPSKSAPSKAAAAQPNSNSGVAKTPVKSAAKTAEKQNAKSEAPRQKSAANKPEASKAVSKATNKATNKPATKATAPAKVSKTEKTAKSAKSLPATKAVKTAPTAVKAKVDAPAKKGVSAPKKTFEGISAPAPRKRAPSGATQGQILSELAKGEALSIDALCQRLNKQTANMYKMVASLHAQGQIQKSKSAGRGYVYSLTGSSAPVHVAAKAVSKTKAAGASESELLDNLIDKLAGAAKVFLRSLIRS